MIHETRLVTFSPSINHNTKDEEDTFENYIIIAYTDGLNGSYNKNLY